MSNGDKKEEEVKEGEKKGKVEGKVVNLSEEQYGQLLDRIAELEELSSTAKSRVSKEVYDIDELAEEGKRERREKGKEEEEAKQLTSEEIDNMSNTQLVNFIFQQGDQRIGDMNVKVETLRVLREIDKAEDKYPDFWKHEKEVRQMAIENPSLSIDKVYKLVKLEKGEEIPKGEKKKEGEEEEATAKVTRTEKILRLSPRGSIGEKPGVASRSTKGSEIKTLKEASSRAWDEIVGEGKETF